MSSGNRQMPSVYGLVLAGGKSTRMGTDKAPLLYEGKSQLQRAYEMLVPFCDKVFISVRKEQSSVQPYSNFPQIQDVTEPAGPSIGILSAFHHAPNHAWLVVACDLPFLDSRTLENLIARRNPRKIATAYYSAHDRLPEPLCAIYEPAACMQLQSAVSAGRKCPRKFLIHSDPELLEPTNPEALENINTPDEYRAAVQLMEKPKT